MHGNQESVDEGSSRVSERRMVPRALQHGLAQARMYLKERKYVEGISDRLRFCRMDTPREVSL